MSRRQAREKAVQILYAIDVGGNDGETCLAQQLQNSGLSNDDELFTRLLVNGFLEHHPEIDARISQASDNWDLGRIAAVERAILRLSSFELFYLREIPARVIINEALELAKIYDGQKAAAFVNGVLDKLRPKDAAQVQD